MLELCRASPELNREKRVTGPHQAANSWLDTLETALHSSAAAALIALLSD